MNYFTLLFVCASFAVLSGRADEDQNKRLYTQTINKEYNTVREEIQKAIKSLSEYSQKLIDEKHRLNAESLSLVQISEITPIAKTSPRTVSLIFEATKSIVKSDHYASNGQETNTAPLKITVRIKGFEGIALWKIKFFLKEQEQKRRIGLAFYHSANKHIWLLEKPTLAETSIV